MARFNSRGKGNAFERKVAKQIVKAFKHLGVTQQDCYRTPLSGGHPFGDHGDLTISPRLRKYFNFCVECKTNRTWTLERCFALRAIEKSWMRQVMNASGPAWGSPLLVVRGLRTRTYAAFPVALLPKPLAHGPILHFAGNWALVPFAAFLKAIQPKR